MSDVSRTARTQGAQSQRSSSRARSRGWSTRKVVTLALFTALCIILSFVEIALFPAAPYLKYDPSAVVAVFAAFAYGPVSGLLVGAVAAVVHGLFMGDPWGSLMTVIVLVCLIVPAGLVYRAKPTRAGALAGLVAGAVLSVAGAVLGNLLITPIYTGTSVEAVAALIVPVLLPFNVIKAAVNVVLAFLLYEPVEKLVAKR